MVVAPNFDKNALKILKTKKKLILLKIPKIKKQKILNINLHFFGDLYQTKDLTPINKKFLKFSFKKKHHQNQLMI